VSIESIIESLFYLINSLHSKRFADRDMVMRYRGGGIGHRAFHLTTTPLSPDNYALPQLFDDDSDSEILLDDADPAAAAHEDEVKALEPDQASEDEAELSDDGFMGADDDNGDDWEGEGGDGLASEEDLRPEDGEEDWDESFADHTYAQL
jgi:hypothetical protein